MERLGTFILYGMFLVFIPIVLNTYIRQRDRNLKNVIFLIALVLPSLLAAFRGATGTDTLVYKQAYENGVQSVFRWNEFEPGFVFLMDLLNKWNFSYQAFLFVMQFMTCFFVFKTIIKYSDFINIKLTVFIYLSNMYFGSFDLMRQSLAISIGIYAISEYADKKYIKSILLLLLACSFHKPALVCFMVIGFKYIFDNRRSKLLMLIVFGIAIYFVLHREILGMLIFWLTRNNYYASYLLRGDDLDSYYLKYYVKIFPILLLPILNMKKYKEDSKMKLYYGIMVCGYILSSLGYVVSTQVHRIGYYFKYFDMLVIGYCGNENLPLTKKIVVEKKYVAIICYIVFFVIYIYDYFYRGYSDLVPYQGLFG